MSTGVLPFVRGIDFSRNNFKEEDFPRVVSEMTGLKWLKLNKTSIDWIPEQLGNLKNMESLSFAKNNLITLHGEISQMPSLKYLNCKNNRIKNSGIPNDLFKSKDLLILDLSYNQLKEIPPDLDQMKNLQVLNLCHNQIESIPNQLFINLTELVILDLSDNKLETLPPQMRRLVNLNTLILNNNALGHNQLRQLPSLTSLTTLHLRNTQRNLNNIPSSLESLVNLIDLDLAQNQLQRLPEALYTLPKLKRLNLSDNSLNELPADVADYWKNLEILNLSRNNLTNLPTSISRMQKLRRLYLCSNRLDFDGIPSSISKLSQLEVLTASNNNLEMITEGLFRCLKLKKLILSNNKLITLPDTVHLLTDLEELDLANNPDLVMPPKPPEYQYYSKGSGLEYYNIDFSLPNQLRLAGAPTPPSLQSPNSTPNKDPIARKMRLRRKHRDSLAKENDDMNQANQAKVLKGMSELAKNQNNKNYDPNSLIDLNLKPKRWDESLEKPQLNYSEFFDSHVGQSPGLFIWEIENFLPNIIDEEFHGKFYEADCYIILKTFTDENQSLNWQIFYWIGLNSPLDKKACSAIHAVNLRNYLGAQCRTIREEQNDESPEFLALFPDGIMYIEGGRTPSGFFTVEETEIIHRMYRLHELPNLQRQLYLETVPIDTESLDPKFVFVLDAGYIIYVWNGRKAKNTMKQKGRLLAEKINKEERKNKAEIMFCVQNDESEEFWKEILGYSKQKRNINSDETFDSEPMMTEEDLEEKRKSVVIKDHVDLENFKPFHPILYLVGLGMGFLEISQVDFKEGKLKPSLLEPKSVYILDCSSDLFVWFGRKSPRLVKAAALKLSQELYSMINRPDYALITRCLQGTEPQVFKSKFSSWDNVIAVDFTRTADSVARTGANLHQWMSKQDVKIDTSALFMLRQPELDKESARQLAEDWNDELGLMEVLVLEGKKFVKLPENEIGHFYSQDCYVVFCKYWVSSESDDENNNFSGNDDDQSENFNSNFQCVVYFWQGREAPNMGWLTFTFSLQVKFQALFEDKVEIERVYQQKENYKFLSHFKNKFVIHLGKRKPTSIQSSMSTVKQIENGLIENNNLGYIDDKVEMYYLRSNTCPLAFRCIQVQPEAAILNSGFSYILKIPKGINEGTAYVWIGDQCDPDEAKQAERIALDLYNSENHRVSILNEGEEPDEFWTGLGGKKPVDKDCSFMKYTRLFRCSNDKGYFSISEKCSDFCQDDLADDDIMILDNGTQVFIWVGSRCSDVEVKLAYKSAQVYVQNLRIKQPDRSRQLMLTFNSKESRKFKKCFHGWSTKSKIDPRIEYLINKLPNETSEMDQLK